MCGFSSRSSARDSRSKRPASMASITGTTLSATARPPTYSVARQTAPVRSCPISSPIT
jgi:hypothetical protein